MFVEIFTILVSWMITFIFAIYTEKFTILLSIVSSLAASYIFWRLSFKHTDIRVIFADYIERMEDSDWSKGSYRIRICNAGKRKLIEVCIYAKLTIEMRAGFRNTAYFTVGDNLIPRLESRISYHEARNRRRYNNRTKKSLNYFPFIPTIHSNDSVYHEFSRNIHAQSIREKAMAQTLEIDDVFKEYPTAKLKFYVFGNDSTTGARKMYESKEYTKEDIVTGSYHGAWGIQKTVVWNRKKQLEMLRKDISNIDIPQEVLKKFLNFPLASSREILDLFEEERLAKSYSVSKESKEAFIYYPGNKQNRILLVAHVDTIWDAQYTGDKHYSQTVDDSKNGVYQGTNPECGIGADSRASCALLYLLLQSGHSLLLLDGQEHGQIGANYLKSQYSDLAKELGNHQYVMTFGLTSCPVAVPCEQIIHVDLEYCCSDLNTEKERLDVDKWLYIYYKLVEILN